jgi:hypothetical protein
LTVTAGPAALDGVEPALKRELANAETPLAKLPLHREIELAGLATIYITAGHELVFRKLHDAFLLARIAKGESIRTPSRRDTSRWGDYDVPYGPNELAIMRATYPQTPELLQAGVWRILALAKASTADLA